MPNMAPNLSTISSARNPKLLDRVRDVLRRKHYSIRTEQADSHNIRRFILVHGKRHPTETARSRSRRISHPSPTRWKGVAIDSKSCTERFDFPLQQPASP